MTGYLIFLGVIVLILLIVLAYCFIARLLPLPRDPVQHNTSERRVYGDERYMR